MIPVNEPLLGEEEKRLLMQCIDDGWVSSEGPFVGQFESQFAGRVGRAQGVAVSSGSAALEVAFAALGIGPGDEVILPTLTIVSCVAPIVRAGAVPVVVDSDPVTWNMDVSQVEAKITSSTRAILAAHLYGLPIDMGPLLYLAERHGIPVIEDAAEMHGQTYRDEPCGSFGVMSIFSFYPNKLITTGEGGMVVIDDADLAAECRQLRNLCFGVGERRFVHERLGWNFRMTNLQAAMGLAQIERWDRVLARKRAVGRQYRELLTDVPGVLLSPDRTDFAESVYWVNGLVLDDSVPFAAAEAMRRLSASGVATRPFFHPMHEQPVLRRLGFFEGESYPVAENLARRGFYLPSGLTLSDDDVVTVANSVKATLAT